MSFTTVDKVAAMFPYWQRGGADQAPTDAQIQVWIDDAAGDINAVLARRFAQAVAQAGGLVAYVANLPTDALNVLEKLNRWGAAAQLADVFASLGNQSAAALAKSYQSMWQESWLELNGWDDKEQPKVQGGIYDHLFDPRARTETPRPIMQAPDLPGPRIMEGSIRTEFEPAKPKDKPPGT
jgi:hypothetical protein